MLRVLPKVAAWTNTDNHMIFHFLNVFWIFFSKQNNFKTNMPKPKREAHEKKNKKTTTMFQSC